MALKMINVQLEVRNSTAVITNIRKFEDRWLAGVRRAVRETGANCKRLARSYVRVDTGRTHGAIKDRYSEGGLAFQVYVDPEPYARDGVDDYSKFIEYGTRYMAATPFMGPAARETEPILRSSVLNAMRASVARSARGV